MKMLTELEILNLLQQHNSADIRDYIDTDPDGNEEIAIARVFEEQKTRQIKWLQQDLNGRTTGIKLTNGQIARANEFVYLIGAANGLTKIGYTGELARRFYTLNNASPVELRIRGVIETAIAQTLEAELHERFALTRVRGEWFRLTDGDVDWILSGKLWQDLPS